MPSASCRQSRRCRLRRRCITFCPGIPQKVAGTERRHRTDRDIQHLFRRAIHGAISHRLCAAAGRQNRASQVGCMAREHRMDRRSHGEGERMKIAYTRAMISAALNGQLKDVPTRIDPVFGLQVPEHCPDVPDEVLDPHHLVRSGPVRCPGGETGRHVQGKFLQLRDRGRR